MERHYPQKFYWQHALRSEISSKDTSPPPTKQKKKTSQKGTLPSARLFKPVVPFITQYHPAVPNLKEILTMKCYLITATTIVLSNL